MYVFNTGNLFGARWIVNFPTKRHWRGASKIEDIEAGLKDLVRIIKEYHIKSIALPPLGCGLGGLNWNDVSAIIERELSGLAGVEVKVYKPSSSLSVTVKNIEVPKMTTAVASYIMLIDGYLKGMIDPFVRLLELHKLAYFDQEAGEPLKLKFIKHYYGPYAPELRHVLHRLEGHYITGYGAGGDDPAKPLFLLAGAVNEASEFLANNPESKERLERVLTLVSGFESPNAMELMASVHYLMKTEGYSDLDSIYNGVHSWNVKKRRFTRDQIERVVNTLKTHEFVG
jgi:O-acetyl-ADP-ribose deacetylase (regulator of RNase III)